MPRYLAAVSLERGDDVAATPVFARVATRHRLTSRHQTRSLSVWCDAEVVSLETGLAIGSLWRSGDHAPVVVPSGADARDIVRSRGAVLPQAFWGSYVAFVVGEGRLDIVRAPFGTVPVCHARLDGRLVLASDIALLGACGCDVRSIDWREIACHLLMSDLRRDATCLDRVRELRGGRRLSVAGGNTGEDEVWSPAMPPLAAPANASLAHDLEQSICATVAACVGRHRTTILMLSGGLDSSILAAAMHAAEHRFIGLNLVSADASGDERSYARAVARALGVELVEAERRIDRVDVTRSDAAGLPRPATRSFLQDTRQIVEALAARVGADAIVEGGGGDNVFCSLQSVAPVADLIRAGGSFRGIMSAARDIALLTGATLPEVLWRAWYRARWRRSSLRQQPDCSFLTRDAIAAVDAALAHPWLTRTGLGQPGAAAYAGLLAAAQGWVESLDPAAPLPTLCPLLAQPVVKACCRVPTWRWFADGQNRMIARDAFRQRLPSAVIDRRSKATPDSFVTQIYEHNRSRLADLLLDGALVGAGLVDRAALERTLSPSGPTRSHDHRRIMRLADAEAWLAARQTRAPSA